MSIKCFCLARSLIQLIELHSTKATNFLRLNFEWPYSTRLHKNMYMLPHLLSLIKHCLKQLDQNVFDE